MNTKIESYLNTVCNHLPTKKLRKRTRNELSEHFEDILDDYRKQGIPESETIARAIAEMGDPEALHKQLKSAHKSLVWYVRLRNILIIAIVLFLIFVVYPYASDQYYAYSCGTTFEEAEKFLYEKAADKNEDIQFLCKQEYEGKIYYIYYSYDVCDVLQSKSYQYNLYTIESIRAFGKDFHDKFICQQQYTEWHSQPSIYNDILYLTVAKDKLVLTDDFYTLHTSVTTARIFAFVKPMDAKYFTVHLLKIDEEYVNAQKNPNYIPGKSEFYEVPTTPGSVVIKAPDGYELGFVVTLYDENKQEISR